MDHLKLTVDKLSVEEISDLVVDDSCGAVSLFVGTTRNSFEGKKVLRLEYEAYEAMALKAMKDICNEVRNKWPAVYSIAMYHRLGMVPAREASVVIAVSSPHRRDSLDAVSHLIDQLKASVPIWKKEVYEGEDPVWKENAECPVPSRSSSPQLPKGIPDEPVDKNMIQINVSNEELEQRIQNFIERKREQVNLNNIHDYIPSSGQSETEDLETCARIRTQFVRRKDAKGNLKTRKVYNEWGPQTVQAAPVDRPLRQDAACGLPPSIAERVLAVEHFLSIKSVSPDVFKRLKEVEDRVALLQSVSPEYAQFWKNNTEGENVKEEFSTEYTFSADDIARKIEMLERQG